VQVRTSLITGSASSPVGPVYTFAGPNIASLASTYLHVTDLLSTGGIRTGVQVSWASEINGPAPAFWGFGLSFTNPSCVDVRVFDGVTFKVSGDLGTCGLQFSVVPGENNPVTSPVGSCPAGAMCVPPLSGLIGTGTTVVRFYEIAGAGPMSDPTALNAVQWLLSSPDVGGCQANITISDVAFFLDDNAVTPPCPPSPSPCDKGAICVFPNPGPGGCMQRYRCVDGAFMPVPCAQ